MGVYASMSIGGAAVGLMAGGLLTTYLSWRWVLFVNVPIGAVVALLAPRALSESPRRRGRFDLPGAITSTLGLAALVYGLTSAATSANGVSHWGDTKVIVSLTAAVVLLVTFAVIEARSEHALMPLRIFRNRNRSAANLIMLRLGTAMFGMFFFLTIFVQTVWGYSALKTGIAYLPMIAAIMVMGGSAPSWCRGSAPGRCCWPARRSALVACFGCRASASTAPTPAGCWAELVTGPAWACCSCR